MKEKAKPTTTAQPFRAIRRAGVPICCFETADPSQTITNCLLSIKDKLNGFPVVQWDIGNGLRPVPKSDGQPFNEASKQFPVDCAGDSPGSVSVTDYLGFFQTKTPEKSIIFLHNAHRLINELQILQGIWNLRDIFKARGATLVLLAPAITLPPELKHDAIIISDPLPDADELQRITIKTVTDAEQDPAKVSDMPLVIDTLRGLSSFAAEQVLAMSISASGIDYTGLWDRKKKMIEQTPGLSVWQGGETFDDLGGLDNLKTYLTNVLTSGNTPVRAIGFIDEIEKGLAGSAGDTSGTSQDALQVFLKVMQDFNIPGIILLGPAGTGKSAIAKAAGNVAKAPVIAIDTGAMKGSLVGESEAKIRAAMDVFKAVSQGKGLFIATCNKITSLPPELRRRFTLGTFFVDLPNATERVKIWEVWLKRYGITCSTADMEPAKFAGWTGAEIKACCEVSFRTGLTIPEAAKFVVPVMKSAPDQVSNLRDLANGRFISASYSGTYDKTNDLEQRATAGSGRKMDLEPA